jgi:hypothetical protein
MKLFTELVEEVSVLVEQKESGKKDYYIEGIFMQSNKQNRNGRVYPKEVMAKEVARYNKDLVEQNRAFGELGHPSGPQINLERVSHLTKVLRMEGDDVYGKAKILDTPYGNIVKNLLDEKAKIGVSSRGMGSLKVNKEGVNEVQNDFYLSTAADIVADPSAPDAFVKGIMEGVEWVWHNGIIKPQKIEEMKQEIKKAPRRNLEEVKIKVFESFMSHLSRK